MLKLKDLVKSDRRREWSVLKTKHGKELKARKVDFEAKFGAQLDKVAAAVVPVRKEFDQHVESAATVDKVVTQARPLRNIAESYRAKVKGLGGPLERDMTTFLKAVETECDDWEHTLDALKSASVSGRNTPQQMKSVQALYGTLDALDQALSNCGRSLPGLLSRAKAVPSEAKYSAYCAAAGAQAKPEKEWKRGLAADMAMVQSNGSVLLAATRIADIAVKRLLALVVRFDERSDYEAVKKLATSLAANSALKDFQTRAATLEKWMKGVIEEREDYAKGPMTVSGREIKDVRRAYISAAEAGEKLIDPLIAALRKMP